MNARQLALTIMFKGVDGLTGTLKNIATGSSGAQGSLRKLTEEARRQKTELSDLRKRMEESAGGTDDMVAQERRLQDALAKTTERLQQQKTAMARQSRADSDGERARDAGGKNILIGASIAAPLILAGKAAMDFQSGMSDIRIKANLTADDTARLKQNILDAATAAKQLPEDMRTGVDVLAGAGMDPREAVKMMQPIGKAATAGFGEIEDLSRTSFAAVDNLKVPVNQISAALDAMAAAGNAGNFEMKDMAQYFPTLTAQAQALGQHGVGAVADLAAALEIARKGTGDSASAATNLQNLMAKINSKDAAKNFAAFGIDLAKGLKKAAAEGKTPIEAISELASKAVKGDLSKIPLLFQDMQVQQALLPLIQNLDEYRKLRAASMNAKGTVDAAFNIKTNEAAANAKALTGAIGQLAITVGDRLLPQATALVQQTTQIVTGAINWSEKHKGLTNILIETAVAIAGVNLALGAGRVAYGTVIGPLTAVSNAYNFLRTSTAVAAVVSSANGVLAASWAAVTGFAAPYVAAMFSAAAATWAVAWPVLAVLAACLLVGAAIVGVVWALTHLDVIAKWAGETWNRFKDAIKGIDWLKVGGDIVKGLAKGLIFGIPGLLFAFGKMALDGIGHFKTILGIHSPSRVFMDFGGHIADGLSIGINDNADRPKRQAGALAASVIAAAAIAAPVPMSAAAQPATPQPFTSAGAPRMQAPAGTGGAGTTFYIDKIEINVPTTTSHDPKEIADIVRQELLKALGQQQVRARSAYRDDE